MSHKKPEELEPGQDYRLGVQVVVFVVVSAQVVQVLVPEYKYKTFLKAGLRKLLLILLVQDMLKAIHLHLVQEVLRQKFQL